MSINLPILNFDSENYINPTLTGNITFAANNDVNGIINASTASLTVLNLTVLGTTSSIGTESSQLENSNYSLNVIGNTSFNTVDVKNLNVTENFISIGTTSLIGNVSLGTPSLNASLNVNGDIYTSSSLKVSGDISVSGSLEIGSKTNPSSLFLINGNSINYSIDTELTMPIYSLPLTSLLNIYSTGTNKIIPEVTGSIQLNVFQITNNLFYWLINGSLTNSNKNQLSGNYYYSLPYTYTGNIKFGYNNFLQMTTINIISPSGILLGDSKLTICELPSLKTIIIALNLFNLPSGNISFYGSQLNFV